jgi:hypothetical protein
MIKRFVLPSLGVLGLLALIALYLFIWHLHGWSMG